MSGWLLTFFETNDEIILMWKNAALMQNHLHKLHEWSRAKSIRATHGFTFPQLIRLAKDGLIRTSHVKRPGQTRGVRLFHLGDLDRLILESVEPPSGTPPPPSCAHQLLREKPDASGTSGNKP